MFSLKQLFETEEMCSIAYILVYFWNCQPLVTGFYLWAIHREATREDSVALL